jgi:ribose transport system permease protein
VWWTKTWAFMLSSLSATVAGILLVGYAGVHPSVGQGYEFQAITAVVLGGVVLGGGRGWVLSAAAGAFALELLLALLTFRDVESTWRNTVQGIIIILAVAASARAWTLGRRPPSPSGDPSGTGTATAVDPTALPPPRPGTDTGEH